ncbi:MAG: DUF4446 family protein [Ruminococcaceae bacterium]|nr:DUF4446 family protein [Oscillospiraceae bacterium]
MAVLIDFIGQNIELFTLGMILLAFVLLILVIILLIKQKKLARKYDTFMRGSDAESLEESFFEAYETINSLQAEIKADKEAISEIKKVMGKTFQRMAVVRYNAFPGMGGNSSSAVALLTQNLDGMVLNIVHGRDGSYFYVKTVHNAEPDVLLGKEEKEALDEALKEKPIKW